GVDMVLPDVDEGDFLADAAEVAAVDAPHVARADDDELERFGHSAHPTRVRSRVQENLDFSSHVCAAPAGSRGRGDRGRPRSVRRGEIPSPGVRGGDADAGGVPAAPGPDPTGS